jgi:hypothetical protein
MKRFLVAGAALLMLTGCNNGANPSNLPNGEIGAIKTFQSRRDSESLAVVHYRDLDGQACVAVYHRTIVVFAPDYWFHEFTICDTQVWLHGGDWIPSIPLAEIMP